MQELSVGAKHIIRLSDGPFFSTQREELIYTWNVYKVYEENKHKPIIHVDISCLNIDTTWFESIPTCKDLIPHMERIRNCNFNYPILVTDTLQVVDGLHRIMKAVLIGKTEIDAIVVELNDPYSIRHL